MKKIMFYINVINGGGAGRVMANLSSQFVENGYEVVFVTSYTTEGEYLLNPKIKRISLENEKIKQSRVRRNLSRIKKLRNICKSEKPDILISFMAEPNFRAIIATLGLPVKTVISVRNDPNREYCGKIFGFVGKYILPLADGCVFQTEEAKEWFPEKLQKKSTIILNPVKKSFYTVKRNPEEGLIVTCGRLQTQKNHKLLIDAIQDLVEVFPQIRLRIYGEGVMKEELVNYINEKNLSNIISLEGQSQNVPEVLSEADIFVLSSDYEGMPNALMEAMAVGIPSISTDCPCGGPKMLIKNGDNGILVPVNNKNDLAEAIKDVFRNKKKKEILGLKAKESALEFSEDIIFLKWEKYLKEIL